MEAISVILMFEIDIYPLWPYLEIKFVEIDRMAINCI